MSPQQKVIDQVLKLLALADSTEHQDEANTAREMAEKLMLKHDLSIGDVEEESNEFEELIFDTGNVNSVKTRRQLASMCAKFNGVYMFFREGWQNRYTKKKVNTKYVYTGRPQDIENAQYMFDILMVQAKAECKIESKKFKAKYGRVFNPRENMAFYLGFNEGIREKLDSLTEVVESKKQEAGLVPVSVFTQLRDKAMEMTKSKNPDIRTLNNRGHRVNGDLYNAGSAAGANASITRGITKGSGTLRLS